jgi:isocitrate dehydrogenase (NAD+)
MMQHVKEAFRYVRAPVDFEDVLLNSTNTTDPQLVEQAVLAVKRNGVALKANIETDYHNMGAFSANVQIRYSISPNAVAFDLNAVMSF